MARAGKESLATDGVRRATHVTVPEKIRARYGDAVVFRAIAV